MADELPGAARSVATGSELISKSLRERDVYESIRDVFAMFVCSRLARKSAHKRIQVARKRFQAAHEATHKIFQALTISGSR